MYKGLIDTLAFMYSFAAKARGALTNDELNSVRNGANTLTGKAQAVLRQDRQETPEDKHDLVEARMMDEHINEIVDLLLRQELC